MGDRIVDIKTEGNIVSATFISTDIAEVNMFRRAVLSEIDTYSIDIVIFRVNTSPRHDEEIALRLGQLVIDHSRFVPPEEGDFKTHIEVEGPIEFTTEHIPELPFKMTTPIAVLRPGQKIICDVIVRKGQAKTHVKWRPVSRFTFTEIKDGYRITIKEIGMMTGEEIFRRGLEKIPQAAERPPITIFSVPLMPRNL